MTTTAQTHTPGPWEIARDAVPDDYVQLTVYAEGDDERIATVFRAEANARLIAAAPELLEALVDLLDDTQWEYEQDCHNLGDSEMGETCARRAFAEAAIAKATNAS